MEFTVIYVLITALAATGLLLTRPIKSLEARMQVLRRNEDETFERLVELEHRVEVLEYGQERHH